MSGKNKGNTFERSICTLLSEWWTQDESPPRQDVFWRTASSGGRATQRGRKGKQTKNHCGDICATDPIGQPLIDVITWELKRGYNKDTIADLLDKPEGTAKTAYEKWILQARESQKHAGSQSWAIIVKRDRRYPLVIIPSYFKMMCGLLPDPLPKSILPAVPNIQVVAYVGDFSDCIDIMRLSDFLKCTPKRIKELANVFNKTRNTTRT